MTPAAFDHQPRTRLVFGAGCLGRLGELASELRCGRALIVCDSGIARAGYARRASEMLAAAGIAVQVYDQVRENPSTTDVAACVEVARHFACDLIIGVGGGSSMDTAKGCNFILTNGGRMQDYWGWAKASKPMLPLIAIPTTAGTGSECQSYALISDEQTHVKMACGDPKAAAAIALLDPELTLSQPQRVTVCTGIDAISHALESAVCTKRNALSSMHSREAFALLASSFSTVLSQPANLEARSAMQLGAAYAGIAIEGSMLGAAHSLANPLTARFGVIHGEAVGLMLPHVMAFNAADPQVAAIYQTLGAHATPEQITAWLNEAGMPTRLQERGVAEADLEELAAMAAKQWTAQFNPRPLTPEDFSALYRAAL
jgi:alcohol dehydrogenase